jgi:hypothetical protein
MCEHAITVDCALSKKGHQAIRWHAGDLPALQSVSCSINTEQDIRTKVMGSGIALGKLEAR